MVCVASHSVNEAGVVGAALAARKNRRKIVKKKSKLAKSENDQVGAAKAVAAEFSALRTLLASKAAVDDDVKETTSAMEDPLDVVLEAIKHIQRLEQRLGAQASREAFLRRRQFMMSNGTSMDKSSLGASR
jgi:Na+-translocating ferredoxin:NAD+ oxidoreductase RnfC subunit